MLNMLTAPALTLVFLGVVVGLGTAFVWVFWEIEQALSKSIAKPHRNSDRLGWAVTEKLARRALRATVHIGCPTTGAISSAHRTS